jgi:hypothetical protein
MVSGNVHILPDFKARLWHVAFSACHVVCGPGILRAIRIRC